MRSPLPTARVIAARMPARTSSSPGRHVPPSSRQASDSMKTVPVSLATMMTELGVKR